MAGLLRFVVVALVVVHVLSDTGEFLNKFKQRDYHITTEWAEIVRYDKLYVDYASITTFKYNRTCTALNILLAFKVDFGNRVEVIVQVYKFLSNEYRHFPMRFQLNLCDALSKNVAGLASLKKCGNFSGCPIQKGIGYICNWKPDESQFAPLVPTGRYMAEVQYLYLDKEIFVVHIFGAITRPIV